MHRNEAEDVQMEIYRFLREKGPGDNLMLDLTNGERIRVRWEPNPHLADLRIPAAVLDAPCESGIARIAREVATHPKLGYFRDRVTIAPAPVVTAADWKLPDPDYAATIVADPVESWRDRKPLL
jgi:hypothetical protein